MCQAITASLRATATAAMLPPRRAATRSWKARSGPGVRVACQAASTSTCRVSPGPCLEIRPCRAGLRTGLTHARVEAEVADQLPGAREAADLADRCEQRRGGDEVHPGQGEQPSHLRRGEHLLGQRPLDQRDLAIEKLDLAQAGRDRLPLVGRPDLRSEPA